MKKAILALLTILFTASLSAKPIYPKSGEDWAMAKPSKYGFNDQKIKDLRKYIIDSLQTTERVASLCDRLDADHWIDDYCGW